MTYKEKIANLILLYKAAHMGNQKQMKKFVCENIGIWNSRLDKIYKKQVKHSHVVKHRWKDIDKSNEKQNRYYYKKKYGDNWKVHFDIYMVRKNMRRLVLEQNRGGK